MSKSRLCDLGAPSNLLKPCAPKTGDLPCACVLGLWRRPIPKGLDITADSLEHQVADVLGKVTSGEADAGWVYATDAAAAGDTVEVIEIEGAEEFTNGIFGAVVYESENPESAQQLLDLVADDFDKVWKEY